MTRFADVPVGAKLRLANCYGRKIEPMMDARSAAFYASHDADFWGWNFHYGFMNLVTRETPASHFSLAPDTLCAVLPESFVLAIDATKESES